MASKRLSTGKVDPGSQYPGDSASAAAFSSLARGQVASSKSLQDRSAGSSHDLDPHEEYLILPKLKEKRSVQLYHKKKPTSSESGGKVLQPIHPKIDLGWDDSEPPAPKKGAAFRKAVGGIPNLRYLESIAQTKGKARPTIHKVTDPRNIYVKTWLDKAFPEGERVPLDKLLPVLFDKHAADAPATARFSQSDQSRFLGSGELEPKASRNRRADKKRVKDGTDEIVVVRNFMANRRYPALTLQLVPLFSLALPMPVYALMYLLLLNHTKFWSLREEYNALLDASDFTGAAGVLMRHHYCTLRPSVVKGVEANRTAATVTSTSSCRSSYYSETSLDKSHSGSRHPETDTFRAEVSVPAIRGMLRMSRFRTMDCEKERQKLQGFFDAYKGQYELEPLQAVINKYIEIYSKLREMGEGKPPNAIIKNEGGFFSKSRLSKLLK